VTGFLHFVIDAGCLVLSVVAGCWAAVFVGSAFIPPTEFDFPEENE
jgi:hypothetical protein